MIKQVVVEELQVFLEEENLLHTHLDSGSALRQHWSHRRITFYGRLTGKVIPYWFS